MEEGKGWPRPGKGWPPVAGGWPDRWGMPQGLHSLCSCRCSQPGVAGVRDGITVAIGNCTRSFIHSTTLPQAHDCSTVSCPGPPACSSGPEAHHNTAIFCYSGDASNSGNVACARRLVSKCGTGHPVHSDGRVERRSGGDAISSDGLECRKGCRVMSPRKGRRDHSKPGNTGSCAHTRTVVPVAALAEEPEGVALVCRLAVALEAIPLAVAVADPDWSRSLRGVPEAKRNVKCTPSRLHCP